MIRISAKNGANIDAWGTDRAMLNGIPVEELDGEFGNTGMELMIKSKVGSKKEVIKKVVENEEPIQEEQQEEIQTINEEETITFVPKFNIWVIIIILIKLS